MTFYVVIIGRKPGIYRTWDEAKKQVNKFSNCKYCKFSNYKDAIFYYNKEIIEYYNKETMKQTSIGSFFKITENSRKKDNFNKILGSNDIKPTIITLSDCKEINTTYKLNNVDQEFNNIKKKDRK